MSPRPAAMATNAVPAPSSPPLANAGVITGTRSADAKITPSAAPFPKIPMVVAHIARNPNSAQQRSIAAIAIHADVAEFESSNTVSTAEKHPGPPVMNVARKRTGARR